MLGSRIALLPSENERDFSPRGPAVSTNLFRFLTVSLVFCFALLGAAFGQCNAPSTDGVRICFPNQGSAVTYVPPMEMSATTKSGAISKVQVWDNGKLRDNFDFLPGTLFDGSMKNGRNKVTVKLWDTDGNAYQATRSFFVTGYGVDFCPTPSTPGVNFCWPLQGSLQPNNIPVSATARGQNSRITSMVVYLDGRKVLATSNNYILSGAYSTAGNHRLTVVAKDAAGHRFQTSHTFTSFYEQDCNPKTGDCSPGIVINYPDSAPDVSTSFRFQADVQNNPAPTTAMKVYLDTKLVATSSGPGITVQLNLPKNTTHIVWVKAWDTAGKQYAAYQTYFVH